MLRVGPRIHYLVPKHLSLDVFQSGLTSPTIVVFPLWAFVPLPKGGAPCADLRRFGQVCLTRCFNCLPQHCTVQYHEQPFYCSPAYLLMVGGCLDSVKPFQLLYDSLPVAYKEFCVGNPGGVPSIYVKFSVVACFSSPRWRLRTLYIHPLVVWNVFGLRYSCVL